MLGLKLFNYHSGVSRFLSYQIRRSEKLVFIRCNKYFLSRNEVFHQPCHPLLRPKHSTVIRNWFFTSKKCFSISHNVFQKNKEETSESVEVPPEKLSLVKRYKKMLKEYWYVLIPVHMATSIVWFGTFYYIAKSGFDIVPFLESLNLPEKVIQPFRNSSLGFIAVASALYKLATPARYMLTLGGTTVAIKQLTKRGLIKPVSKNQFKTLIKSKLQKTDGAKKDL